MKTMQTIRVLAFGLGLVMLAPRALAQAPAEPSPAPQPSGPALPSTTFEPDPVAPPPGKVGMPTSEEIKIATPKPARDRLMEPAGLIGARVGVIVPQAFNPLGAHVIVEVEGAYQLPFWKRRLGLFVGFGYAQPSGSGTITDARIQPNAGAVSYKLDVREFSFSAGVQYRHAIGKWLVPYVGVGARLHLTQSHLEQSAGAIPVGTYDEQQTRGGFLGRLGLGVHLGPGDLVVEAQIDYTPLRQTITGKSNSAHLNFELGYIFRL